MSPLTTNRNSRVLPDKGVRDVVSIVFIAPDARDVAVRMVIYRSNVARSLQEDDGR